jgi:hypothetical protein
VIDSLHFTSLHFTSLIFCDEQEAAWVAVAVIVGCGICERIEDFFFTFFFFWFFGFGGGVGVEGGVLVSCVSWLLEGGGGEA